MIQASCGHILTKEEDLGTPVHCIVYEYTYGMQSGEYCDKCVEKMMYSDQCFLDEDECWEELHRYLKEEEE